MSGSRLTHSQLSSRRFRRLPFWWRLWLRLSPDQQARAKSISWAASVHFLLIAVLAAISLANPSIVTINLSGALASSDAIETFELLDDSDIDELIEEELEELTEQQPSEDEQIKELLDVELPLDQPTDELPSDMEAQPAAALQQVQLPSALSDLTSDQEKISETNRRVAAAGGMLEGPIRVSLIFSGDDDIDLHVQYEEVGRPINRRRNFLGFPMGLPIFHVFFANPRTHHAALDVDANAVHIAEHPCENIIFRSVPRSANYTVAINHYRARGVIEPTSYVVVVNYGRKNRIFEGSILPQDGTKVLWTFKYSG